MANHAGFGKLPAIVVSSISNSPFLYLRHWRLARRAASPGRSTLPGAVRDVWLRFATTSAHRSARSRVWLAWRASPSRLANFRRLIEKCRFAADSPLEGDGFELPVPGREKASPFRGVGTVREATNGGISKWELMLDRWVRSVPRIRLITHAEPLTAPLPRGGALLTLCEALYADRAIPAASRNGGLRPACRDERSTAASTRRSA
jgi:hypothetical protein